MMSSNVFLNSSVGESNPLSSHTVTTMSPESGTTMICWPWLPEGCEVGVGLNVAYPPEVSGPSVAVCWSLLSWLVVESLTHCGDTSWRPCQRPSSS
jgi:hypothetical protein